MARVGVGVRYWDILDIMLGRVLGGLVFFAVGCIHFAVLVNTLLTDRNGTVIAVTSIVGLVGLITAKRFGMMGFRGETSIESRSRT
jgi:hypothetical protein